MGLLDGLDPEVYEPFARMVEITFKGKKAMVPDNNFLLRCFQYLDEESIMYGQFCWNNDCGNCEVAFVMQDGEAPQRFRACCNKVREGMKVIETTRHVRIKIKPSPSLDLSQLPQEVTYVDQDGNRTTYTATPQGWQPSDQAEGALSNNATHWYIVFPNRSYYAFDTSGRLVAMSNALGLVATLSYT